MIPISVDFIVWDIVFTAIVLLWIYHFACRFEVSLSLSDYIPVNYRFNFELAIPLIFY
jgi:hypothetical protein